jgi:hypothetical protein
MNREGCHLTLTRRGVLTLAGGAGIAAWSRLYGSNSDFWNKKEPAEWTSAEVDQMITKSPWAKETNAQYSHDRSDGADPDSGGGYPGGGGGGYPSGGGGGYPGGGGGGMGGGRMGGGGIPGMGGGGMGGGRRGGGRQQQGQSVQGTVRWESAKPVVEAMKAPLPDAFASHYVISISGFPLNGGRRRSQDDSDSSSTQSTDDMLDQLKSLTYLQPKGRDGAQPGVVQKSPSSGGGTVLFGFSKEMLALKPEDKEVTFSTKLGHLLVKTKFNLKDMMYHGELAI